MLIRNLITPTKERNKYETFSIQLLLDYNHKPFQVYWCQVMLEARCHMLGKVFILSFNLCRVRHVSTKWARHIPGFNCAIFSWKAWMIPRKVRGYQHVLANQCTFVDRNVKSGTFRWRPIFSPLSLLSCFILQYCVRSAQFYLRNSSSQTPMNTWTNVHGRKCRCDMVRTDAIVSKFAHTTQCFGSFPAAAFNFSTKQSSFIKLEIMVFNAIRYSESI